MYWEQAPYVGVPLVFNSMPRNRFREIKKFIHLNDNSKIDKTDKMYKLRLYFDILKKEFGKFGVFHSELSLDEMMVRYYGKHSALRNILAEWQVFCFIPLTIETQ